MLYSDRSHSDRGASGLLPWALPASGCRDLALLLRQMLVLSFLLGERNRMTDYHRSGDLQWEINVPLATNRLVLRQLGLILVIPAAIVALLLFTLGVIDNDPAEMRAAGLVFLLVAGIFIVLLAFAILLVFSNRMRMTFTLDEAGVHSLVIDQKARVGRILAMLLGFLTLNPTLAGAGLLAQANRGRSTPWADVRKIELMEKDRTIVLRGKRLVLDAIFCNEENFDDVLGFVQARLKG